MSRNIPTKHKESIVHKIAIRHVDKHNRPRGQTIYQINQRLFVALQQGIGEQLIACECVGERWLRSLHLRQLVN